MDKTTVNSIPTVLTKTVEAVIEKHGGVRATAKAIGVDAGYLTRLRDGEKTNPSDIVLRKLGLREVKLYVWR